MVIQVSKCNLKIGILGFRHKILTDVLDKYDNFSYNLLDSYKDIDETYDLVLMSGVHYIIPEQYLSISKYGIFGFHESPLPEGRGSAPIYWTIKTNRINFTISLFKADKNIDSGHIVLQNNVGVSKLDTYYTINEKRNKVIQESLKTFLDELNEGFIVLRAQRGNSSYTKKRTPLDSLLDSTKSLDELWDDIRACDNENFPAYFIVEGKKIFIKYTIEDSKE